MIDHRQNSNNDRIGLGWRRELAVGILAHLDRIDVVEVIADDLFDAPKQERRALGTLAAHTPVVLHGVSLGLASTIPADEKRLEKMARLCEEIQPQFWSEHLAFVRGGGIEIGHLTAPPRTLATIEGAAANLVRARSIVGSPPLVENIATLIDPPGSDRDEITWIREILDASNCEMLLDLHNLYANGLNFGFDPVKALEQLPMNCVRYVHLAGGKWIGPNESRRLLDDHLHDVPPPVYDLLAELGARAPHAITVILERDGRYPPIEILLDQLDQAREALDRGRALGTHASGVQASQETHLPVPNPHHLTQASSAVSEQVLDSIPRDAYSLQHAGSDAYPGFLAKIYVDTDARARFLADPRGEAQRAGLNESEITALEKIDRIGLVLAAQSLERKRSKRFKRIFQQ